MILVPHYIGPSAIAGMGLFTAIALEAGTPVYLLDDRFLLVLRDDEVAAMPTAARDDVLKYSYRGKGAHRLEGAMYYCADDSRFMNHADDPNLRSVNDGHSYVAARAIAANTELTCDYGEFCDAVDLCFDFNGEA